MPQRRTPSCSQRRRIASSSSRSSSPATTIAALSVGESGAPGTKLATIPCSLHDHPAGGLAAEQRLQPREPLPQALPQRAVVHGPEATAAGARGRRAAACSWRIPPSQRAWSSPRLRMYLATSGWGRIRKRSSLHRRHDVVGDLLGLDDRGDLAQLVDVEAVVDHRRVDELRAQAGDAQAAVAVGDVQPLRDRDGGVLGRRRSRSRRAGRAGRRRRRWRAGSPRRARASSGRARGRPRCGSSRSRARAGPSRSSSSSGGPPGGPVMPALEKKASIGPCSASASAIRSRMSCSWPTSAWTAKPPISSAVCSAPSLVEVGDRDLGVLVGEAQRARAADPARPARDHDVPARQLHGAGPYSPWHGDPGDPPRPPAARRARRRRLRAGGAGARRAGRGAAARPQPLHERRPVHARAHERREVLRAAVRARARRCRAAPSARSSARASWSSTTAAGASTRWCSADKVRAAPLPHGVLAERAARRARDARHDRLGRA